MAGNSAEPGRSVTSKVAAILLSFHDGSEHSLTEIAQLTCLPISTAHRLVTELAGWGLLERTDESRFRVGSPVQTIGSGPACRPAPLELARRVLEDLTTATHAGAQLGLVADGQVAYVEKRCDYSPVTAFGQTPRLPAHATALGKALLAFSCPDVLDAATRHGLVEFTPNTLTDLGQLRQCLATIRLTRVAIERGEYRRGVFAVAVPVFGAGGLPVAALGLTIHNLRTDLPMARSVLTVAARGLSRELTAGKRAGCLPAVADEGGSHRAGDPVPQAAAM